jgi:hypothetical protein
VKYSWEVWEAKGRGLFGPVEPRLAGYDEAPSSEALAEQVGKLDSGQRLMVWDTPGVGRLPVLVKEY